MRRAPWISSAFIALVSLLVSGGCGQSPSHSQPSTTDRSPALASSEKRTPEEAQSGKYDVRVASAEGRATARPVVEAAKDEGEPNALPAVGRVMPLDEDTSEELLMPRVVMSAAHAKLCRVQVGDTFPAFELADLKGDPHALGDLLGKRLTIVLFWSATRPTALDELVDLEPRVQERFGKDGVAVLAVNCGDDPKLAAELADHAKASFVNLADPQGQALASVGTPKVPRTYLLDASGKIVWFDIEYSRTTRRELTQAIRFMLAQH
jgi:peroxiredoxin